MKFRLDKPDIFKVYHTIENRDTNPVRKIEPIVRYFYPGAELIELGVLSKGFNAFTVDCDKYRKPDYIPKDPDYEKLTRTYLYNGGVVFINTNPKARKKYDGKHVGYVIVRSPGATRGVLVIDLNTNLIIDVLFNNNTCFNCSYGCYTKDILSLVDIYKGTVYSVDYIDDVYYPGDAL